MDVKTMKANNYWLLANKDVVFSLYLFNMDFLIIFHTNIYYYVIKF